MLPVTIIGGYLGAGKTTLVNHLLRHAEGVKLAVLVNEFGDLPIDEDLIEAQNDQMISIAGGCVCCSYGNDLTQAMIDLSGLDQKPDHILIESSGVAMPGAIASSVSIIDSLHVEGIIVLADSETIREQAINDFIGDTITQQLLDADLILLNKCDLIGQDSLKDLKGWLRCKAPDAAVLEVQYSNVPTEVVLQHYARSEVLDTQAFHPHADAFESTIVTFDKDVDATSVAEMLACPDLQFIRAKGFVPTSEGMRAIHVVGRRWAVSDAPPGATSGVVVIAQKVLSEQINLRRAGRLRSFAG